MAWKIENEITVVTGKNKRIKAGLDILDGPVFRAYAELLTPDARLPFPVDW